MSRPDDVRGMRDDLERLLADPASTEAGLAASLRALRSMADRPAPEPGPALRRVLADGLPPVVPVRSRLGSQALEVERRRRAARRGLLSLGLGAKIALVAGAAAAVTGAAVVDPLPESVREPAREVVTHVGDVVAPWGRGARGGHGAGERQRSGDLEERSEDGTRPGGSDEPGRWGTDTAPAEPRGKGSGPGPAGDVDPGDPGAGDPGGQGGQGEEAPSRGPDQATDRGQDDPSSGRSSDRSSSGSGVAPAPTAEPDPAAKGSGRSGPGSP